MSETKALAVVSDFRLPVLTDPEFAQRFAEEMNGETFSPDRVKWPAAGALMFELPGEDPNDPDLRKVLRGVIVDNHPVNAFWSEKYSGQKNPPDCSALDGQNGIGKPGGKCNSCPYNEFGTGTNDKGETTRGKACKNIYRVFLLEEGSFIPFMIAIPPTSRQIFSDWKMKRVLGKGHYWEDSVVEISLTKNKNAGGIEYSQGVFKIAGKLPLELAAKIREYAKGVRVFTRQLAITQDDYDSGSEAPAANDAYDDSPV